MRQSGKQIERRIHQISRIIILVAAVILAVMMLVQTVDVVGRYLFDKPLKATLDYLELGMGILVFWGLAYCASTNEHIRVDLLLMHLSKRAQETVDRITFGAGAFILALMTWRLADRAWSIIHNLPGPVTMTMMIPYWPFLIVAAFGSLVFCLEYLIRVFNPTSGKEKIEQTRPLPSENTDKDTLPG